MPAKSPIILSKWHIDDVLKYCVQPQKKTEPSILYVCIKCLTKLSTIKVMIMTNEEGLGLQTSILPDGAAPRLDRSGAEVTCRTKDAHRGGNICPFIGSSTLSCVQTTVLHHLVSISANTHTDSKDD